MMTREDIEMLASAKLDSVEWHQVTDLSDIPAMEESGFGMEAQTRKGGGYTAYFYHFHDGAVQGVTLVVYIDDKPNLDALASDISAYIRLKDDGGWR